MNLPGLCLRPVLNEIPPIMEDVGHTRLDGECVLVLLLGFAIG